MEQFFRPKVIVLKGEEAIEVLEDYITEIEGGKAEELTEKQAEVMIKLARGLISAIDEETTILETARQSQLMPKLKNIIERNILQAFHQSSDAVFREPPKPSSRVTHYHPPPKTQQIR